MGRLYRAQPWEEFRRSWVETFRLRSRKRPTLRKMLGRRPLEDARAEAVEGCCPLEGLQEGMTWSLAYP